MKINSKVHDAIKTMVNETGAEYRQVRVGQVSMGLDTAAKVILDIGARRIGPVLVVCPPMLRDTWMMELGKIFPECSILGLERGVSVTPEYRVYIVNWLYFLNHLEQVKQIHIKLVVEDFGYRW